MYNKSKLKMNSTNYWEYTHNKLQYLLDIHKTQASKTDIFPFDLSYMLNNQWNKQEKDSYKVVCIKEDFDNDDSVDKMININIDIIKKTREQIHEKLQYLLDIHKNKQDPFPLDLSYMLDLSIYYMDMSFDFDKNYKYDRQYPNFYYSGKLYAVTFLLKNKDKSIQQFEFFDMEEFSEKFQDHEPFTNLTHLEIYIDLENIPDEVSDDYLLWKSACHDNFYDYKRSYPKNYYDPDKYLPEEEIVEPEEYYGIYEDDEPLYQNFNHFNQAYSTPNANELSIGSVAFLSIK
jgi:hypothetical protein